MKYSFFFLLLLASCKNDLIPETTSYAPQLSEVRDRLATTDYNKNYCLLVDFSIHSGRKRMFLYNLETQSVEASFLVAHGDGCGQEKATPSDFSNVLNSNCSSVGFSVLGSRAYSNWGINVKYWLKGLDPTNDRMEQRVVVLHSWGGIPDTPIYPIPLTQSQGCFTVSLNALRQLDEFFSSLENPKLLLYAFKE